VEEELGELPPIEAVGGRVNQVLLNILLNAAQAIASKQAGTPGVIRIRSWRDRDSVFCSIEDNGREFPRRFTRIFSTRFLRRSRWAREPVWG
jgi:signal transduction histidine kinase